MRVTSFRELMREQANAAVRVSGAHHSSWNGRFGAPIARQSDIGGTANWDNSISYNPQHVDDRLQQMFSNARVHNQDRSDLREYRDALRVVLHENVHLLSSEGREHSQAYSAMANLGGVRALEEGVTELYSHQVLNDYIDDLGIDQIAPGIKDVRTPTVYPQYTPAVDGFAETVGRKSGMSREEVIGRLAVTPADQKFTVAAATMYDNSRLAGTIPEDQRDQAVAQIADAMRREYSKIDSLPRSATPDTRRAVGMQAAAEGSKAMSHLRKQWQMPSPSQQVQRDQGAERGDAARAAAGSPAAQASSGRAGPAGQGTPELPPDIAAAARAGFSGPPLSSAARLSPDRQGARRPTGTTPAAQRQGPETQR